MPVAPYTITDDLPHSSNLLQQAPGINFKMLWNFRKVITMCLLITFAGFLFGYDTGVIGGILQLPSAKRTLGKAVVDANGDITYTIDTVTHGLLVSTYHIGCIIGGITIARAADFKGRRMPMMFSMFVYCCGNLIQILTCKTGKWYQFMIGRFVTGICIGSIAVLGPMFISETAPTIIRGSLTSCYQNLICTGILVGASVIYATKSSFDGDAAWVIPLALTMGVSLLVCIGIIFTPESARYLISIGKIDEARQSLIKTGETNVESTLENLRMRLTLDRKADEIGYMEMVTNKRNFKRLMIGVTLMFLQQMSGIDYFFYFGTQLFSSVGIKDSYLTMILLGSVNYATSILAIILVERFGRKRTLLTGSVLAFITLMIYSTVGVTMVDLSDGADNRTPGYVMITFTCLFLLSFGSTWSGCVSVVVNEVFSLQIRSKALGVSMAFCWGANFFIAFCTPIITDIIHYAFGYVFAGCMFVSFFFVLFVVPETKGISLEEMDALFEKRDSFDI
uniref:MFS transporter n=1 Tax=Cyberlindnera americana TaxID=36016 RepID=A0A5P8N8F9_9ASCO|nr:MFS transporter [Cyberlindnera americana]